jgi:hypothetical protein
MKSCRLCAVELKSQLDFNLILMTLENFGQLMLYVNCLLKS